MKKYILAVFLVSLVLVFPVFAQEEITASPTPKRVKPELVKDRIKAAHQKNLEIRENLKMRASDAAQKRKEKLSEARLNICRGRANLIGNRIRTMINIGTNRHKRHENLVARVDAFYNNKLVPNGYTLSNYDDLKADIEANKANVLTLLDSAKAAGEQFNCESDDPKGQAETFKEDMKALIDAIKEYKASIKNYVTAVHGLAKEARLDKLSPSPSPVLTPEVTQ